MPKHLTVTDAAGFVSGTQVGAANGVAPLGADSKIPATFLPSSTVLVASVNGKTGTVVLTSTDVGAVASSTVGNANGVAPLDSAGRLPVAKLPSVAVQSVNGYNGPSVTLAASDVGALTQTLADARYLTPAGGDARYPRQDTIFWNVKDHGAAGNGAGNDATAIQSTIDACSAAGGGTVFFPAGTYQVGATINVPSNIKLIGANRKSSVLRKSTAGVLVSFSGPSADATGATHIRYGGIQDLTLNGNGLTGALLRCWYADNLVFRDMYLTSNADVGVDGVEFWDTRFYNCVFESMGGAADSITPMVYLRNSAASSGFGWSADNVNQIYFHGCRWENFNNGALRIDQGPNNSSNPNGIYLTDNKMESSSMRGGAHLYIHASCRSVQIKHLYCFAGNFFAGYSTPQNIIALSGQDSVLEDVLIANGSVATINSGVDAFSGAGSVTVLRNVIGKYVTAPTGVHIYAEASSTADWNMQNCYSNNGSQYGGTIPTKWVGSNPLTQVAGPVSDANFTRGQPNGTLAIDTTNTALYARIAGAWTTLGAVSSVNGQTGAVTLTAANVGAVATTAVGAANGVAGLDASSKLNGSQQLYSASIVAIGSANAAGAANSAARGDHVHAGVTSVNGSQGVVTVTPAGIGAVATTAVAAASGVASLDASTKVPVAQIPDLSATYTTVAAYGNTWMPSDHGLISWTMDPGATSASGTPLSAGFIYMLQVVLRQAATISKINVVLGTAGATLTANQCLAGLYNTAGTRVGITADMSTTWNSAGNKTMSLTSSFSAAAGKYYVALIFNGTTSPTFACGSTLGATFTPGNANLAAGTYRWCRSASGQTTLPTSVTLSGYTPDANNIYAAVG